MGVQRGEITDHMLNLVLYRWSLILEVKCEADDGCLKWEEYHFDWNKSKGSNDLSFYISNNQNSLY